MFQPNVSAIEQRMRTRLEHSRAVAVSVGALLLIATSPERPAAVAGVEPRQSQAKPRETQKDISRPDVDFSAERKLVADLETAIATSADYVDFSRLDRDLAAAFREFGLDLDVVDPKTAGARLAGRASTPVIAAAIDRWCRVRKTRLRVRTCAVWPTRRGPSIPTPGAMRCAISTIGHQPMLYRH